MAIVTAGVAFPHPNRKRLLAWLDGVNVTGHDAVTAHVERCDRCADRLEEMSADVEGDDDGRVDQRVRAALREIFDPPAGVNERVMQAISERQRIDRELDLVLGLFAIPSDAASLLMPDESSVSRDDALTNGDPRNRGDVAITEGEIATDAVDEGDDRRDRED